MIGTANSLQPLKVIASGGMGQVLKVQSIHHSHPMALKFFPISSQSKVRLLEKIQLEMSILSAIHHQGVVSLLDGGILCEKDSKPCNYLV